ncbi:MAG: hypothetical protein ACSLEZ_03340, partial [Thiobacillus sp.]
HTLIVLAYPVSHDLNSSNRPVRTRMPGGVAGARPIMIAPYADPAGLRQLVLLYKQEMNQYNYFKMFLSK